MSYNLASGLDLKLQDINEMAGFPKHQSSHHIVDTCHDFDPRLEYRDPHYQGLRPSIRAIYCELENQIKLTTRSDNLVPFNQKEYWHDLIYTFINYVEWETWEDEFNGLEGEIGSLELEGEIGGPEGEIHGQKIGVAVAAFGHSHRLFIPMSHGLMLEKLYFNEYGVPRLFIV